VIFQIVKLMGDMTGILPVERDAPLARF